MTNIETGKYSDISDVEAAIRELSIIFQALPSVPPNAQVYTCTNTTAYVK